jgi:hypothetical protein
LFSVMAFERLNFSASPLFLLDIQTRSSVREDHVWCPVRALIWHLKRAKSAREVTEQLLITTQKPFKAAARSTLARWLIEVIQSSRAVHGDAHPTPHSIGHVASTWAFL